MKYFKFIIFLVIFFIVSFIPGTFAANVPSKNFHINTPFFPVTLDWNHAFSTSNEIVIIKNIARGLVSIGGDLQIHPDLAEKYTINETTQEYRFFISPKAKWSNGIKIEPQDFIKTWERVLNPSEKNPYSALLFSIVGAEEYQKGKLDSFSRVGLKAEKNTLIIKLKGKDPLFLLNLGQSGLFPAKQKNADSLPASKIPVENLLYSGAFVVKKIIPDRSIQLAPNPHYEKKSSLNFVEYVIEPDLTKVHANFQKGDVDIATLINSVEDLVMFKVRADSEVGFFRSLGVFFLGFNLKKAPFNNIDFRRSLQGRFSVKKVVDSLGTKDDLAHGLIPPGMAGTLSSNDHSQKASEQYLRTSVNFKDIPELKVIARSGHQEHVARSAVNVLKDLLQIPVNLYTYPHSEFRAKLAQGDFDLYLGSWYADVPDGLNFLQNFSTGHFHNTGGYSNPEFDRLVLELKNLSDLSERTEYFKILQKILLYEDVAIIPLLHPRIAMAYKKKVKGVNLDLMYTFDLTKLQ